MGIDSIISWTRSILTFFRGWAIYLAIGVGVANLILFVNASINDIYARARGYSLDVVGGGIFFNNILNVVGMVVPANITAVLTLVVSIQLLRVGIVIFISLKKLYWDMLFYLNK